MNKLSSLCLCLLVSTAYAEDDYEFMPASAWRGQSETGENDATSALGEGFDGLEDEPGKDLATEPVDGAGGFDNVAPKLGAEEGPGGLDWDPSPTYRTRYKSATDYTIGTGTRLQGNNWFLKIPYITYDSGTNQYRVRFDANQFRVYTFSSGSTWVGKYGNANSTLVRSGSSGSYTWALYDTKGKTYTFTEASPALGRVTKIEGLGDPEIEFTYAAGSITVLHKVSSAGSTEIRRFTYTITSSRLDKVEIEEWVTSAWVLYRKIDFTYPEDISGEVESSGGDLIEIKEEKLLSPTSTWLTRKWVYKYFTGAYNSSTNPGSPYQVKAVLEPEAVRDYEAANPSTGIHTQTAAQLASYVDRVYEYASDKRCRQIDFKTACCGGGEGVYGFAWDVNGGAISNRNTWAHRVTVTLPSANGSSQIIDYNDYGQRFNYIAQEDAGDAGSRRWIRTWAHNTSGTLSDSYSVAACTSYNDSTHAVTTNTTAGMRFIYTYGLYNELILKKLRDPGDGDQLFYHKKAFSQVTSGSRMRFVKTSDKVYPTEVTTDTGSANTTYAYTYHSSDALQVKKRTTTMPVVATGENGSNSAVTLSDYFSLDGLKNWSKDGDSYVHYVGYDSQRQTVTKTVRNIDTDTADRPSGVPAPPSGEGFDSTTGLNIVTDFEYDTNRRLTKHESPAFNAWTGSSVTSTRTTKRWWHTKLSGGDYVMVEYPHVDAAFYTAALGLTVVSPDGHVVTEALGELGGAYDDTTLSDDFDATQSTLSAGFHGTIVRRTDFTFAGDHVTLEEVWSDADNGGASKFTTEHTFDAAGRKLTTENPAGTITRWTYDVLNREKTRKVGTIDGGGSDNMTLVEELFYDEEEVDADNVGDGTLTQRSIYTSNGGAAKDTNYAYDYRTRLEQIDEPMDVQETRTYTNRNQVAVTERLDSSGPTLMAKTENFYDTWGRVYEVRESGVSAGTESGYASVRTWRNARGLPIKRLTQGKILEKTQYNGAGQVTNKATTYDTAETTYADADDLTGDTVIEETRVVPDASGRPELVGTYQRRHNGSGTGALTVGSSGNSRPQYTAKWFDPMHRESVVVAYGTNDGTDLTSRSGSPPSTGPSETDQERLVTTYAYTIKSEVFEVSDPMGRELRTEYNDPGLTTKRIENYVNGTPGTDDDRTMEYTYDSSGRLWKVTAKATTTDQITEYVYGVTRGTDNSTISSNDYVKTVKWPDSSTTQETMAYDAQGKKVWEKNAQTTERFFDHDDRGRRTEDRAQTIGSGLDTTAKRISYTYDALDRPIKVSTYDNATAGSGTCLNQIQYEYTRFDKVLKLYQEWTGLVNTAALPTGSPRIEHAYSFPSDGTTGIRKTQTTLTGGQVITDEYTAGIDDNLSRISGRKASSVWVFQESYLGLDRLVERQYGSTGRLWTLVGTDSVNNDNYIGLDRMGRIDDLIVKNGGTNLNRYVYTYNYNSQITLREDEVGTVSSNYEFDEKFVYDALGRLTEHKRGKDLNGSPTVRSCESWALTRSGATTTLTTGTSSCSTATTFTLTSATNRITEQDPGDIAYTYNAMGALTQGCNYAQAFDGWGRMSEVSAGGSAAARYKYSGQNEKIKRTNSASFLDTYYYYDENWRLLEERKVSDGTVLYWYVWGEQYIDDIVARSVSGGSTTKYFVTDARFSTTTVLDSTGAVSCRYCYDAYGNPKQLSADWSTWQATTDDRFLFTGRFHTKDVFQNDLRNRTFDPCINYFLQSDPAGRLYDQLGFGNGLVYAGNDPVNLSDPFGNAPKICLQDSWEGDIVQAFVANAPTATMSLVLETACDMITSDGDRCRFGNSRCPQGKCVWNSSALTSFTVNSTTPLGDGRIVKVNLSITCDFDCKCIEVRRPVVMLLEPKDVPIDIGGGPTTITSEGFNAPCSTCPSR